jgi:hypothetical protein
MDLATLVVWTPAGEPVPLSSFVTADRLLVVFLRHLR